MVSAKFYPLASILASTVDYIVYKVFDFFYPITKLVVQNLLRREGIEITGQNPGLIQILNTDQERRFYTLLISQGTHGLWQTYNEGTWSSADVVELFSKFFQSDLILNFVNNPVYKFKRFMTCGLFNSQTVKKSLEVAEQHYDLGNDFFKCMLGESMVYSCAYWKNASTLEDAQRHKLELIAKKLHLKEGMRVLDVGCGWGSLCEFLAKNYKVSVVGLTIGVEGAKVAKQRCKDLLVDIRVMDYRTLLKSKEKFDRVVAIEIFEHVGLKNYNTFFETVKHCLTDEGLFLMQNTGINHDVPLVQFDLFLHKNIYPNVYIPLPVDILNATYKKLIVEDWHNFGYDFYLTFMEWRNNLATNYPALSSKCPQYDEKLFKLFHYFLSVVGAAAKTRKLQLWQIVFSKNGIPGCYDSVR